MGFESDLYTFLGVLGVVYIGTLIERVSRVIGLYSKLGAVAINIIKVKKGLTGK